MSRQVCDAVQHMHSRDLCHRDLKPHNVLLSPAKPGQSAPVAVLMDLGSAAEARVSIKSHSQAQRLQDEAAERCSISYRCRNCLK